MKTQAQADSTIKIAALVVGGIYAYRRFSETLSGEEAKADSKLTPLGQFIIGWSVVFLVLSLLAPASPTLAGNMALLVMIAALLSNGTQIAADLKLGLNRSKEEQEALHPKRGRKSSATIAQPETRTV